MITEDYVSYETAKLLKEKGFIGDGDIGCWCGFYSEKDYEIGHGIITKTGREVGLVYDDIDNSELDSYEYLRPTLQMAMKWLEKVHHILVIPDYVYEFTESSWNYKIYRLGENGKPERCEIKGVGYSIDGSQYIETVGYRDYDRSYLDYETREEAEEEGIRYVLKNLI
jgi:hypothetical protein